MSVFKYPKIDTLYERDKETFKVDVTKIRRPEFLIPREWLVTEKIHGTNIRVSLEPVECAKCGREPKEGDLVFPVYCVREDGRPPTSGQFVAGFVHVECPLHRAMRAAMDRFNQRLSNDETETAQD